MNSRAKMLNVTKWTGSLVIMMGIITLFFGIASGFNSVIGIGVGTVVGGIFISLMGMFFVATEEMVENTFKGIEITSINITSIKPIKITPIRPKKGAP